MILKENTKDKIEHAGQAAEVCRALLLMEDKTSRERRAEK